MNWIRKHRPSPGTAFGLAALVIALGGAAFAAIPDSSGTIHACYNKSNGNLRVVESADRCRTNERAIKWNQEGPPGQGGTGAEIRTLGDVTLSDGESRVVLTEGPLTYTARCLQDRIFPEFENPVPRDKGVVIISTTENHSAAWSPIVGGSFDFGPSTPESEREVAYAFAGEPSDVPIFTSQEHSAATPSGTRLSGILNVGVNALGRSGQCVFGGHLVVG